MLTNIHITVDNSVSPPPWGGIRLHNALIPNLNPYARVPPKQDVWDKMAASPVVTCSYKVIIFKNLRLKPH